MSILNTTNDRRIFNATAGVSQARDWSVVAEARELILHRLGQRGAVYIRVLWHFVRKVAVDILRISCVHLESFLLVPSSKCPGCREKEITYNSGFEGWLVFTL